MKKIGHMVENYIMVSHKNFRHKNINLHIPNIDAISGALLTLRNQFEYTQTQCNEGARDGIDIWYMGIIFLILYNLYKSIYFYLVGFFCDHVIFV